MLATSREERRRITWFRAVFGLMAALQALLLVDARWDFMSTPVSLALMLVVPPVLLSWIYWGTGWIRRARPAADQAAVAGVASSWRVRVGSLLLPAWFFVYFSWRQTEGFRNGRGSLAGAIFTVVFTAAFAFVFWLILRRKMTYWAERAELQRRQRTPAS